MKRLNNDIHKNSFVYILVILFALFGLLFTQAYAYTYNQGTSTTNVQDNSNSGSNSMGTGGNNNGNGSGNGYTNNSTIQTGNASTNGVIINHVNTNIIHIVCNCTPTPGQATPTPISVTATPTPGSGSGSTSSGGSSSGGSSSAASAGQTQAVLGASAMASTGSFMDNMMNSIFFLGFAFVTLAFVQGLKKKGFNLQFELQY